MQQTITHTDPVCHMLVTTENAAPVRAESQPGRDGKSDYKGKTYYFCSKADKAAFDKEPEKYVKTGKEQPMPR